MSEVSKFHAADDFTGELCVLASDFDRVTAECKALQERLNAADQKDDDLEFLLKDREGSRQSWFDEAKRLEKEVEELRAEVKRLDLMGAQSDYNYDQRRAQFDRVLAERDALLRDIRQSCELSKVRDAQIDALLSTSAEPSVPVERDERADFIAWAERKNLRTRLDGVVTTFADQLTDEAWQGWQARAALERKS